MVFCGMGAGNKGVQSFDPVGKPIGGQKIERIVGDRGLRILAVFTQVFEDVVCPHSAMFFQQDFQYPLSDRDELQPSLAQRAAAASMVDRMQRAWLWGVTLIVVILGDMNNIPRIKRAL